MTAFYDADEPDRPDYEADEAMESTAAEHAGDVARDEAADYLQPGELSRSVSAASLRRHWLSTLGDVADPRAAAAQWLAYARARRRGVEADGVRECAVSTFHEAATMAARTFATAYLDGNVQPVWLGAFALLRDRETRARAQHLPSRTGAAA